MPLNITEKNYTLFYSFFATFVKATESIKHLHKQSLRFNQNWNSFGITQKIQLLNSKVSQYPSIYQSHLHYDLKIFSIRRMTYMLEQQNNHQS